MKTVSKILALTACFALFFSSCGWDTFECEKVTGDVVTEAVALDYFHSVKLRGSADVYITQGDSLQIEVEGPEDALKWLNDDVSNQTWVIDFDKCLRNLNEEIIVRITMPDIELLSISGSGLIFGENTFVINDLKTRISGSGKIDLILDADDIESTISGSGDIQMEGVAQDLDVKITGSGDVKAYDLELENGKILIGGSGSAKVTVSDNLEIDIVGSGDVYYKGYPELDSNVTGSGSVIDAN